MRTGSPHQSQFRQLLHSVEYVSVIYIYIYILRETIHFLADVFLCNVRKYLPFIHILFALRHSAYFTDNHIKLSNITAW